MRDGLVLCLDLGTSSVRALAVDRAGCVHGRSRQPLRTRFPSPGRVEQDPEALWQASRQVLRAALSDAGPGTGPPAAIGIVTQRATTLAWDADSLRPLAPALGWQDQRGADIAARLRSEGLPVATQSSAPRWVWWLEHDERVRAAARRGRLRLGTPDVWLTACLTAGRAHVTDPGQASCTGLYDLESGTWSREALALVGLDPAWLPRIVASDAVVEETDPGLTGVRVPVAARAGDQQAAAFAQGVLAPGRAKLTLGTAAMLDLHTGAKPLPPRRGAFPLSLWRLTRGGEAFCLEGSVLTAGAALDWAVELGLLASPGDADRMASSVPDTAGVWLVPSFQGLGAPFLDDRARGLLLGLTRGSRAPHLVRALLEGIAHRVADVCEALAPMEGDLRVDGGLARSDFLLQRIAEWTGRRVLRARETETTALGGAFLAALGIGWLASPEACQALLAAPQGFTPRMAALQRERERERWREAVRRARGDLREA